MALHNSGTFRIAFHKTTCGKLLVFSKWSTLFRFTLVLHCCLYFVSSPQLTDSQNGGGWQTQTSAKDTLYSHREATARWVDDGKTGGVIHHVAEFTGLSHSPRPLNPPKAWQGLAPQILWSIDILELQHQKSLYTCVCFHTTYHSPCQVWVTPLLTGLRINPHSCQ